MHRCYYFYNFDHVPFPKHLKLYCPSFIAAQFVSSSKKPAETTPFTLSVT
jgi:hypothetical protein